ncbi:translation initiation factor IF-3 [Paenibacillus glufosinatiresistens]|uniref:translation initiation factor IF-3 n=1 Tax=Paenibacillus glufosinatiresistens TaxID=3070657 RepID=UPI00286E638C|nr:translation initiation factor IF-3 [Paenibacillus sp. YX.27]
MAVLINEQIRAAEVDLTGLDGEALGVVSREEALALARAAKADLVCTSLLSSPPPCRLAAKGTGKARTPKPTAPGAAAAKAKELRLTPGIEEHDYRAKLRQADKLLRGGTPLQLVVRTAGAKEAGAAKAVLERLLADLKEAGVRESGIQTSGKGAQVKVNPR